MRIDGGGMQFNALRQAGISELRRPANGSVQIDGGKGQPPDRDDVDFGYVAADGSTLARQRELLQEGEDGVMFLRERFYPADDDQLLSTDPQFDTVVVETGDGDDTVVVFNGREDANGDRVVDVAINGVLYTLTLAPGQTLEVRTQGGDDEVFVDPETGALLGTGTTDTPVFVDTGTGTDFVTPRVARTGSDFIVTGEHESIPQIVAVDASHPPATVEAAPVPSPATPPVAVPPTTSPATPSTTVPTSSTAPDTQPVPATPVATTSPGFVPNAQALLDSAAFQALPQDMQALLRSGLDAGGDASPSWLARAGALVDSPEFQAMTPEQQSAAIGGLVVEQVYRSDGEHQLVGPFPSADAAAVAALDFAGRQTAADDLEHGGLIFFDPETGQYYVSTPATGDPHEMTLPAPSDISDLPVVAYYHTHTETSPLAGIPGAPVDAPGEGFSLKDIIALESGSVGSTAYLGSPGGIVFKQEATPTPDPNANRPV